MYKKLEIVQNNFGGIDLFLDGEQVKGCTAASLNLEVNSIPTITMTIMVHDIEVDINKVIMEEEDDDAMKVIK